MNQMLVRIFTLATFAWATPAIACTLDPFFFQLDGETKEDAEARSEAVGTSFDIVDHYNREKAAFDKAQIVFLGKVRSYTKGSYIAGKFINPSTQVTPIVALKGEKPERDYTLIGEGAGGLCTDAGDGMAAFAQVGTLVVVFDGVPVNMYRPRGIDSFPVADIRTVPLLDLLRAQGKDLEQ